jgi:ClpP class serine protease
MTKPLMNHPLMAYAGHAWALTREALSMITAQAAVPSPGYSIESQPPDTFEIRIVDGIAVIPVNGVMANDHGWTGYFSGTEYAGYKGVRQRVEKALADPDRKSVV